MLQAMGVDTGIDLEAMIEAAAEAERAVGHTLPSQVLRCLPPARSRPEIKRSAGSTSRWRARR